MAEAATSRKQRSDVRNQNFKVSPMATIFKTMNNVGDLDTPGYITRSALPENIGKGCGNLFYALTVACFFISETPANFSASPFLTTTSVGAWRISNASQSSRFSFAKSVS